MPISDIIIILMAFHTRLYGYFPAQQSTSLVMQACSGYRDNYIDLEGILRNSGLRILYHVNSHRWQYILLHPSLTWPDPIPRRGVIGISDNAPARYRVWPRSLTRGLTLPDLFFSFIFRREKRETTGHTKLNTTIRWQSPINATN